MMKKTLLNVLSTAAILVAGFTATAQNGCYAVEIESVQQGTRFNGQPITDPIRISPEKTLGQPQNDRSNGADNFFSLGKEGYIVLKMNGAIISDGTSAPDLRVYETTWGNKSCNQYPEYAEVSVSYDGVNFYMLGTFCQGPNISIDIDAAVPAGIPVSYVKIANSSALGSTDDYFDVDGVEALFGCGEVPELIPGDCFASCMPSQAYVQGTTKNGGQIPTIRTNPDRALGQPQNNDTNNFVTLGYGGSLTICFNGPVINEPGNDLFVIETSFYGVVCENYHEYADVEVSIDGVNWYMVGTGCLDFGVDISDASVYLPYVNWVRIKNNDTLTNTPDGFDIDAVIALHGDCNTALVGALAASESERPSGDFTVYPNPTKGDLNFNFSEVSLTGNVTLELFNINGQKVATIFQGDASTDSLNNIRYNASNLSNGMYITKLTTNEGVMTNKVMIAK